MARESQAKAPADQRRRATRSFLRIEDAMAQLNTPMSIMDAIYHRRSVRAYSSQKLDRAAILPLLDAAVRAPTAMHGEPWAFAILQDTEALTRVSDRAKALFAEEARRLHLDRSAHALDIFSSPEFNIFYNASTLIVICARPMGPFVAADCWLAAENLMLAAHAMGLGTCVIGSALLALNTPEGKAELGIPSDFDAFASIIAGVPTGEPPLSSRNEPTVLSWK
jgi:nitroreductase